MARKPPLRRLLEERVAAARSQREQAATADRPKDGVFTPLNEETTIHFCTIGRKTGERRDKWWIPYAGDGDTLYLIEAVGTNAQWVKNFLTYPGVEVWGKDGQVIEAKARLVIDEAEDTRARRLVNDRFDSSDWELIESGTVVAFDLRT